MKRTFLLLSVFFSINLCAQTALGIWKSHFAYGTITELVESPDEVFALSSGAIFSLDKTDYSITRYDKQSGLNGTTIAHIDYCNQLGKLFILYEDGMIDLLSSSHGVENILDLYSKQMSVSKKANAMCIHAKNAYLAMPFGVVCVNIEKREIADTYYMGDGGNEVNVLAVSVLGDSIFAQSNSCIYVANLRDNLVDFNYWKKILPPSPTRKIEAMKSTNEGLYVLQDSVAFIYELGIWKALETSYKVNQILSDGSHLILTSNEEDGYVADVYIAKSQSLRHFFHSYSLVSAIYHTSGSWLSIVGNGLAYQEPTGDLTYYFPNGPVSNNADCIANSKGYVYVLPGGYWASQNGRMGQISCLHESLWSDVWSAHVVHSLDTFGCDFSHIAIDPQNPQHYFVASYGTGIFEFEGTEWKNNFLPSNSDLRSAVEEKPLSYTRVGGLAIDSKGNLWALNAGVGDRNLVIRSAAGDWYHANIYSAGARFALNTPTHLLLDKRNERFKWIVSARSTAALVLYDDCETPLDFSDDKAIARSAYKDQDNKTFSPSFIYTIAQDRKNDMWVGTEDGLFVIPSSTDWLTSNSVERVKIPRNDGTNLADYLLDGESVKCIAVDGVNRKWVGTASSGLFLFSEDGQETVEHFTATNSPLLSDNIVSLSYVPENGMLFVGTDAGIVSYQTDSSEPSDSFSDVYAYPNPVRPEYSGTVVICGLMEGSHVKITDASGNLMAQMTSNGGLAVWDGKNLYGKRVASGVYLVFCTSSNGSYGKATSILFMN